MRAHRGPAGSIRRSKSAADFFCAALAALAILLQTVAGSLLPPLPRAAAGSPAELAGLLEAHALCIAGAGKQSEPHRLPVKSPHPSEQHDGICCAAHCGAAPCLPSPLTLEPVAFADNAPPFAALRGAHTATHLASAAQARAPPSGG